MNFCAEGFYFFVLNLLSETLAVNIALWKTAVYCKDVHLSDVMFDTRKMYSEAMMHMCHTNSYIGVSLGNFYMVHFVTVFEGYGTGGGQLDFFEVYTKTPTHPKIMCSKYPGKTGIRRGYRVNCVPVTLSTPKVIIDSMKNKGFYITEIEVHTLGEGQPTENILIHRGCYEGFGERKISSGTNLERCQTFCLSDSYIFAGIKGGSKECLCANNIEEGTERSSNMCNYVCDDGVHKCGGDDYASVYLILPPLPHFKGCLKIEPKPSEVAEKISDMVIDKCLLLCDAHRYALLHNGDTCFCKDDVDTVIISHDMTKCNIMCGGQPNTMCGGLEHASIFATCKQGTGDHMACSQLFKCASTHDMYGDCGSDGCREEFAGRHCLGKEVGGDVQDVSGDPTGDPLEVCQDLHLCDHMPLTNCKMGEFEVFCSCVDGYLRDPDQFECLDLDECLGEPCEDELRMCLNLNGSYTCACKPGFLEIDGTCFVNVTVISEEESLGIVMLLIIPLIFLIALALTLAWSAVNKKPIKKESISSSSTGTTRTSRTSRTSRDSRTISSGMSKTTIGSTKKPVMGTTKAAVGKTKAAVGTTKAVVGKKAKH